MTPDQIELVQTSFARLVPQADAVAQAFYERLFHLDPALRDLFPADLSGQRAKLMQTLGIAVQGLQDLDGLRSAVAALGRRHAGYGVQPRHYDTVGQALIDTLRSGLGAGFTPPLAGAWSAVYVALAGAMQAGAETPPRAAIAA